MTRKLIFLFLLIAIPAGLFAQRQKADSLANLLAIEKTDTAKVKMIWQLAALISFYDPERALLLSQEGLLLSTKIKYTQGQSKCLGEMAIAFNYLGNYPKALELNLRKLKLEEKGNNPHNLAMTLLNIGSIYTLQEEYNEALKYYYRSDSVIILNNLENDKYLIYMCVGEVYDRLNNIDSAFSYFNKSLVISNHLKNEDYIGNSMTGLAHVYYEQGNTPFSLLYYRTAIQYLQAANNDDVTCEATLGLARLYKEQLHKNDSAVFYATLSLQIAQKDGFINKQLDAVNFLSGHYQTLNKIDSAYFYLYKARQLNDSINSKEKIRELQVISSNEKLRQQEIEENKKIAKQERKQQLQYLFIGIFIPGFFLLTLLLSRIRIHIRVIKILGILSLLILFEYLTLLLHPRVAILTNHTPVYEMLIFVSIAAIIIPGHHRIEQWLIQKLIHRNGSIKLKKFKLKVKGPSE